MTAAPLTSLTRQLADFLELPASLDLPRLASVQVSRTYGEDEWSVEAALGIEYMGDDVWAAMADWAVATGGALEVKAPFYGADRPFRTVNVYVAFAGQRVRVWAHVAADAEVPERYRQIAQVAA